ncbi:MAG: Flp pilus assembly protein CpaB, partial [Alphaproteobacteria bacterium]
MRVVLLLVAAVIAIVAGVAALKLSGDKDQGSTATVTTSQPVNSSTAEVLVAREQINVGTVITAEMLSRQPWPSHLVLESFIVSDGKDENTIGKVARATFMPYEPLLKTRLGNPNDPSFLAATLPSGMRAMTLATDVISGVAGYVFPGDRVDVLVTHNVPAEMRRDQSRNGGASAGGRPAYAEVLVPNARVLAVNLRPAEGPNTSTNANTAPNSITLEVPESVAQEVRLAEKLGTL